jgi:prevent-host-death family protein
MTVTAKDLRFNVSFLFDVLSKGEDVTITHRGKAKAKLISYDDSAQSPKDDAMFGMWSDKDDDVDMMVRNMRKRREF